MELAHGTIVRLGNGGDPETFTPVAHIKNVGGPKMKRDSHETTDHDSPDYTKEFVPGLIDGGEVGFEINMIKANMDTLATAIANRTVSNWQIIYPYESSTGKRNYWAFAGFVTGLEPTEDNTLKASITIKVTKKPEFSELTWPET